METAILQRLSVLEDAFRRSENTTSHILTRIKEIELAINNIGKLQEKQTPDMHYLREEVQMLKRQAAHIDSSWRQANAEMANSVQQDLRSRLPQQIDAIHGQLRAEQSSVRHDVNEVQISLRRMAEQFVSDQADVRGVLSATKWSADQLQAVSQQHRDGIVALEKRLDGAYTHLREFQVDVERNAASFRENVEQAVRAAHGDALQRIDSEARARDALQSDIQTALNRLRDDAVRGFANSAALSRVLEDNLTSLETVLRAEVRSRMTNSDEGQRTIQSMQQQLATLVSRLGVTTDGNTPRGGGKDLNGTMSSTGDSKAQLDRLWAEMHHVKIQQHDTMERVLRLQVPQPPSLAPLRNPSNAGNAASPAKGTAASGTGKMNSPRLNGSVSASAEGEDTNGPDEDRIDNTLFDKEVLEEGESETARHKIEGCLAALQRRLTEKASLSLIQRLRTEMNQNVDRRVESSLQTIQARLQQDQAILELQLQKLREELEAQFHSMQTVEHRVVTSSRRSSRSSSASRSSRSSSRRSSVSSRDSDSVRRTSRKKASNQPTPRTNVMERLN